MCPLKKIPLTNEWRWTPGCEKNGWVLFRCISLILCLFVNFVWVKEASHVPQFNICLNTVKIFWLEYLSCGKLWRVAVVSHYKQFRGRGAGAGVATGAGVGVAAGGQCGQVVWLSAGPCSLQSCCHYCTSHCSPVTASLTVPLET